MPNRASAYVCYTVFVESDANYRCVWCVVVEWGEIEDQAAALDVGVGSSACRMLDTHFDRKAESSAMNESVFVA